MRIIFQMAVLGLVAACATQRPPQRYAWVTGLKPTQAAHYEELHAHVWPDTKEVYL